MARRPRETREDPVAGGKSQRLGAPGFDTLSYVYLELESGVELIHREGEVPMTVSALSITFAVDEQRKVRAIAVFTEGVQMWTSPARFRMGRFSNRLSATIRLGPCTEPVLDAHEPPTIQVRRNRRLAVRLRRVADAVKRHQLTRPPLPGEEVKARYYTRRGYLYAHVQLGNTSERGSWIGSGWIPTASKARPNVAALLVELGLPYN